MERWIATRGHTNFESDTPVSFYGVAIDITQRKRNERAKEVLISELQHRTPNIIAVVRSISNKPRSASASLEDYAVEFNDRLAALARIQGLLSRGDDADITIRELVEMELDAVGANPDGKRFVIGGPRATLPHKSVHVLALALHELATNALKHGALCGPRGRLEIRWEVRCQADKNRRLRLDWLEREVQIDRKADAARGGYGRKLLEQAVPYQLDATTQFNLHNDGVHCWIDMPLNAHPGSWS